MRYVLALAVLMSGVALGQELPEDTDEIKTLTVEQATALAQHGEDLDLNGLTALDAATAKALAEFKGESLGLDGLTTLNADTAKAIAEFKGRRLYLNGLTTLSDEATAALQANPDIVLPKKFKR